MLHHDLRCPAQASLRDELRTPVSSTSRARAGQAAAALVVPAGTT